MLGSIGTGITVTSCSDDTGSSTSCFDGIKNGDETSVDCGGSCPECPTCDDGIKNGDETGIDCGGSCEPCTGLIEVNGMITSNTTWNSNDIYSLSGKVVVDDGIFISIYIL